MNARDAYHWMEAGNYEGKKTFNGRKVENIMRVYAKAVADGIVDYVQSDLYQKTDSRLKAKSK